MKKLYRYAVAKRTKIKTKNKKFQIPKKMRLLRKMISQNEVLLSLVS